MKTKRFLAALLISGCTSNPDELDAAYVSPIKCDECSCKQLTMEMDYVGQRTSNLHERLKSENSKVNWQM